MSQEVEDRLMRILSVEMPNGTFDDVRPKGQPITVVTRKPTSVEVALHEAMRHREIMATGLLDGIIPIHDHYAFRRRPAEEQENPHFGDGQATRMADSLMALHSELPRENPCREIPSPEMLPRSLNGLVTCHERTD